MTDRWGYDEPNGIIIGGFEIRYEFWQGIPVLKWAGYPNIREKVAVEYFEQGHDEEALEWFRTNYPENWARRKEFPIEMRVYDQPGKKEQARIDAQRGKDNPGSFTDPDGGRDA